MALTKEVIDQICDSAPRSLIDTVKQLRYAWPMGLKEATSFIRNHQASVDGLRKALYDLANLREGMVFENSVIRIELKTADASFQEIRLFLIQAMETMYPNLTLRELQDFCTEIIASQRTAFS